MFELVKRDGRREEYDGAKLAQSLRLAGVPPFVLSEIVSRVGLRPITTTKGLRASIETELKRWHPDAAIRYAQTCRLHALGSNAIARGSVQLCPEMVARFGAKTGDTIWLRPNGTSVPLTVETVARVEPDQIWLNRADLARMGINPGTRLLVTGVWPALSAPEHPYVSPERNDRLVAAGAL
jgi:hypothetical protein